MLKPICRQCFSPISYPTQAAKGLNCARTSFRLPDLSPKRESDTRIPRHAFLLCRALAPSVSIRNRHVSLHEDGNRHSCQTGNRLASYTHLHLHLHSRRRLDVPCIKSVHEMAMHARHMLIGTNIHTHTTHTLTHYLRNTLK